MNLEALRTYCLSLPGVTEDIKWEHDLCFSVGSKMFLVVAPDQVPTSASFKASDEDFAELTGREGFRPAPYLARYHWVWVDDIGRLTDKEWLEYARRSYDLVFSKLPARIRQQLAEQKEGLPDQ